MNVNGATERGNSGGVLPVSVIGGVVWAMQAIVYAAYMLVFVPKQEVIYKDFGVALPLTSRWFINQSRDFCATNPGQSVSVQWVLVPLWLLCIAAVTVVCARRATMRAGMVFLILGVLWALLSLGLLVVAMQWPMHGMVKSLEGGQ